MLIRLSQPSYQFVSTADVKPHAVVDTSDDDLLLAAYIDAATRLAEDRTGRILRATECEFRLDNWCDPIVIPTAPVREIMEVAYLDEAGIENVVLPADWYSIRTHEGAELYFRSFSHPLLSSEKQSIRIRFMAGFDEPGVSGSGDDPELAQEPMDRMIVKLLAAHWYQRREPVGEATQDVPFSAEALIRIRRIFR